LLAPHEDPQDVGLLSAPQEDPQDVGLLSAPHDVGLSDEPQAVPLFLSSAHPFIILFHPHFIKL
jgi:hypothetical protein